MTEDDRIVEITARANRALPGHSETPAGIPGVVLASITPSARDLLDRAMDGWQEHYVEVKKHSPEFVASDRHDPVYAFAYWLFRWSGLIDPEAAEDRRILLTDRAAWQPRAEQAKRFLRKLVEDSSAGLFDDKDHDLKCVYCFDVSIVDDETIVHRPSCPIAQARAFLGEQTKEANTQ